MRKILKFRGQYLVWAIVIFIIEILIALFAHDRIVRPYVGDFLVVMLVYCFLRSFLNVSVLAAAISSLIFSYLVETLQYFDIVTKLGLQNSELAKVIIGSSFEWIDMVAYTAGIIFVLCIEKVLIWRLPNK